LWYVALTVAKTIPNAMGGAFLFGHGASYVVKCGDLNTFRLGSAVRISTHLLEIFDIAGRARTQTQVPVFIIDKTVYQAAYVLAKPQG